MSLICNECDAISTPATEPLWFKVKDITFCKSCAPSCENCKQWDEHDFSKQWRAAKQSAFGMGFCDHIKTEPLVEIIGIDYKPEDPDIQFETPSYWGCNEWGQK